MSDNTSTPEDNSNKDIVSSVSLVDEMKKSYLDYAMSVIVSRALPDCRDELKAISKENIPGLKIKNYKKLLALMVLVSVEYTK